MPSFEPRDPEFPDRVAATFSNESVASRLGGELVDVGPGSVCIRLPISDAISPSQGTLHRSYVAALLDDTCILAGLSLTSAGDEVRMAEYKLNFLAPARGERIAARAEVVRPGRSVTVCRADAFADGRLIAKMLATLSVSRPG